MMGTNWRMPTGLHTVVPRLPVEGELPSFDGATGWLNSPVLTPAGLRGKVVLTSFWTYTCINWLRQLPYLRAWAGKYAGQGLVVIGVHTPEFGFEHDPGNVRRAAGQLKVDYPVATDNDYAVWRAFGNHYWPALYFADAQGRLRHHYFGEGEYSQSEMVIQQLLAEAGSARAGQDLVSVDARGVEAPADWDDLRSASQPGRRPLPWALGLACVLAVAAAGLLAVTDLAGMVMGSWDTPAPGLGWLKAGAIGQLGLAGTAVAVLVAGAVRSSWRRRAVVMAGAIIALEAGWFLLTRMLAAA